MSRYAYRPVTENDIKNYGNKCYKHSKRDAVFMIVTEFSCYGNEEEPVCDECKEQYVQNSKRIVNGQCDRCGDRNAEDIIAWRDPEEGAAGAYLDTCRYCRS